MSPKFSTLQPPWSRGALITAAFHTDVPTWQRQHRSCVIPAVAYLNHGAGGQLTTLVAPLRAQATTALYVSNISSTQKPEKLLWELTSTTVGKGHAKLTVNLGLRGGPSLVLVLRHHGAQVNFVPRPALPPNSHFICLPAGPNPANFSASFNTLTAHYLALG